LTSFDLGLTQEKVLLEKNKVIIRNKEVPIKEFENLKENTIYVIEGEKILSIDFFSESTNLYYKLKPTSDWPTVMLSSVPMHRFKTISPKTSAELMTKEISPIEGKVLETCCGLGYTSIISAKTAEEVVVFENDLNVLRIAEYNPYSQELFTNPKIRLIEESVFEGIKKLKSNSFDRIIHDPPTVSFAKELYFPFFYSELFRVLKPRGILYHYCPNPGKTKGKELHPGIIKNLVQSGFVNCNYHSYSSGIRAMKK
jgi:predicted methyltransferase